MKNILINIKNFIWLTFLVVFFIIFTGESLTKSYADESANDKANEKNYLRYYYSQLGDEAKLIYDALFDNIENTKSGNYTIELDINNDTFNKLKKNGNEIVQSAMDAFDRDNPQVFWLDITKLQIRFKSNRLIISAASKEEAANYLISDYSNDANFINNDSVAAQEVIDKLAKETKDMSEYDKIKYLHDYLVKNNDYNSTPTLAGVKAYKSISAILGNTDGEAAPVCEGYARAFKMLCDRLSVPCIIVSGKAIVNGYTEGHMWNYVEIDDKWFAIDVTWDDPIILNGSYDDLSDEKKYEYFLFGKEKELEKHTVTNVFTNKEGYDFEFKYPSIYPINHSDKTPLYSINITKYSNGVIETNLDNNEYVKAGVVVKLTVNVKEGMKLIDGSLKFNGKAINDNTFTMPDDNVTITASFITDTSPEETKKPDVDIPLDNEEGSGNNTSDENKNEQDHIIDGDTDLPVTSDKPADNTETKNPEITEKPKGTNKPATSQKPVNTQKPDNNTTYKPENTKKPPITQKPSENNEDYKNEESDVILEENNFEINFPMNKIEVICKADISMGNKEIFIEYKPYLADKDAIFYISNSSLSNEVLNKIISSEYLVRENSILDSLHIIIYDNEKKESAKFINKENPVNIFIPVDQSWINKDYEEYFYLIENNKPEKKIIRVRESHGQYYLHITMESNEVTYAIIRRRADDYVIPGNVTLDASKNINKEEPSVNNQTLELRLIVVVILIIIALILTIRVFLLQRRFMNLEIDKRDRDD